MWTPEQENAAGKLLARLRAEPLAKEREEFGKMLMRHIDDLTPAERKRYNELKAILHKGEQALLRPNGLGMCSAKFKLKLIMETIQIKRNLAEEILDQLKGAQADQYVQSTEM